MTAWSRWLLPRMPAIRRHKHVARFVDELDHAVKSARHAVDRPVELEYICMCPVCHTEVRAPKGAAVATCRECARAARLAEDPEAAAGQIPTYDVADEHLRRIDAVKGSLLPAKDLGTAIGMSWAPVNVKTIRSWINSGRLIPKATRTEDRVDLFHVGDALNLAAQIPVRREPVEEIPPPRRRRTRAGQPA